MLFRSPLPKSRPGDMDYTPPQRHSPYSGPGETTPSEKKLPATTPEGIIIPKSEYKKGMRGSGKYALATGGGVRKGYAFGGEPTQLTVGANPAVAATQVTPTAQAYPTTGATATTAATAVDPSVLYQKQMDKYNADLAAYNAAQQNYRSAVDAYSVAKFLYDAYEIGRAHV